MFRKQIRFGRRLRLEQFTIKNGNQEVLHVRDARQTAMQQIVIGPIGGSPSR
jgi:hypothetical protein